MKRFTGAVSCLLASILVVLATPAKINGDTLTDDDLYAPAYRTSYSAIDVEPIDILCEPPPVLSGFLYLPDFSSYVLPPFAVGETYLPETPRIEPLRFEPIDVHIPSYRESYVRDYRIETYINQQRDMLDDMVPNPVNFWLSDRATYEVVNAFQTSAAIGALGGVTSAFEAVSPLATITRNFFENNSRARQACQLVGDVFDAGNVGAAVASGKVLDPLVSSSKFIADHTVFAPDFDPRNIRVESYAAPLNRSWYGDYSQRHVVGEIGCTKVFVPDPGAYHSDTYPWGTTITTRTGGWTSVEAFGVRDINAFAERWNIPINIDIPSHTIYGTYIQQSQNFNDLSGWSYTPLPTYSPPQLYVPPVQTYTPPPTSNNR